MLAANRGRGSGQITGRSFREIGVALAVAFTGASAASAASVASAAGPNRELHADPGGRTVTDHE